MHLIAEAKHWSITLGISTDEEVTFYWDWDGKKWNFSCVATDIPFPGDELHAPQLWHDDWRGPFSYYELDEYTLSDGRDLNPDILFSIFQWMSVSHENELEEIFDLDDLITFLLYEDHIKEHTDD